jgi:hypothetical protein
MTGSLAPTPGIGAHLSRKRDAVKERHRCPAVSWTGFPISLRWSLSLHRNGKPPPRHPRYIKSCHATTKGVGWMQVEGKRAGSVDQHTSVVGIADSSADCLHDGMEIKARILDCSESDEHIVRRLGKAVVVQWDSLPKPVQYQLLKQAALVHDRERILQLRQKIQAFIQKWKALE